MKVIIILLCLACCNALAVEAEVGVEVGFSTNPLSLEKQIVQDGYISYWFQAKHTFKINKKNKIDASFKAKNTDYFKAPSDKFRIDYRLRYSKSFKTERYSHNLMLTHDFRSERQIYFNRISNTISQTNEGFSLGARYDFDEPKLGAEWIWRLSKLKSISLYGFIADRNYINDYNGIEVDSLDYLERGVQLSFRLKTRDQFNMRAFVYNKTRFYKALLNSDVDGVRIDGSILDYNFLGYGIIMNKTFDTDYTLSLYGSGYFASDNAQAYRDMVFHKLNVSLTKHMSDHHFWKIESSIYIKDYLLDSTRPIEVLKGNPGRIKLGNDFKLTHQDKVWWDMTFYQQYSFTNETNSLDLLSFNNHKIAIGLIYHF